MDEEAKKEKGLQAAARSQDSAERFDLERIFEDHAGPVLQAAYRVTGNRSDAEDVLQTIFLRLLRRGYPAGFAANLGSYLHRAAVNASIDLLRSRGSRPGVPLESVGVLPAASPDSSPELRQRELEVEDWLRRAVARLSPQAAEMFTLRYFEGYQNQEIADLLGTSPGVVAVVLHRSRQRLRDEIRSFLGETNEQA